MMRISEMRGHKRTVRQRQFDIGYHHDIEGG